MLLSQPQLLPGLLPGQVEKILLQGHAHHLYLLGVAVVGDALIKGHQHPAGPVGRHFRGQPRQGIALVDAVGNSHALGGIQCREAGIAAGADDHIGLKLPVNFFTGTDGGEDALDGVDIFLDGCPVFPPAQAGAGQALQVKACLGHQLFFHVAGGADEEDFAVRIALSHSAGNCNGRVDMSGGTAAGKNQIHGVASCIFLWFRYREICKRTPICPRFTASAVPP